MTGSKAIRRRREGGADLFAVVLLATVAIAALTGWYAGEIRRSAANQHLAIGSVFAAWLAAAHRATQENDFVPLISTGGGVLTTARLRALGAVPPGLPDALKGATITLGVIDDGNGVPMAFAILSDTQADAVPDIRRGMARAGIVAIEPAGGPPGSMAHHRSAIETATGALLPPSALFVTADTIPVHAGLLHRRPQPGRPWLTRMEAPIEADGHDITNASLVASLTATATSDSTAAKATVDGEAVAPFLSAPTLDGARIAADGRLIVSADLLVGTLAAVGTITAAAAIVTGDLQAARLIGGTLAAQDVTLAGAATVISLLAAADVDTGTIPGAPSITSTSVRATSGVYGPALVVSGTLTVGSCDGCRPAAP